MKHLLLLGAGPAHLQVLQELAAQPLPGAQVTLVAPFPNVIHAGSVPDCVAGHREFEACTIPLEPLARRAGASFIASNAVALDTAQRELTLADGSVGRYDVLSLDTEPALDRQAIPGASEHALFARPLEHFVRLWDAVRALAEQRTLHVVTVGDGTEGADAVELALAMQQRLGERARVSLITGGSAPLSTHPDGVQRRVRQALRRARITVLEDTCVQVAADHVMLGRGTRLACDAPVLALGPAAPAWLQGSGLALDATGRVATGACLQSLSHPEVFAVGDVACRGEREGNASVAPTAPAAQAVNVTQAMQVTQAAQAGPALALNLRRFVAGGELVPHRPPARTLSLLSCGDRRAIATWATWAAWGGWSVEGRWVWRWKERVERGVVERYRG